MVNVSLLVTDRQEKAIAVDTIIHQTTLRQRSRLCTRSLGTTCIGAEKLEYLCLCIGQKKSSVANLANKLTEANAMNWTTIVAATASDPAPLQF
jgi:F0F1-type ATP synthase alpha subunit